MATRRRKRSAELTRFAVLAAAETLFAQHGFWGVSMRDLSRACGVSQPLIHHHFGTKEALYEEVKKLAIERFRQKEPLSPGLDLEGLRKNIETMFSYIADNRNLLRLTSWARLEDAGLWPGEADLLRQFSQGLAEAQKQGCMRKDINPLLVTIMISAMVFFWCEERTRYRQLFDRPLDLDKSYIETMFDVLARGIAAKAKR